MINAVIFDMDGLLIDSEPFWRAAQRIAFASVGVDLTEQDLASTMGRRIDEVVSHWYHERPWNGASQKDIEARIVDKVIELIKTEGVPKPGVMHVLNLLKTEGMPLAIASSSATEIIDAVVDKFKIRSYFTHIYSAENETHGKPHPGVYITTASLLQTPPHRCLAFEDSPSGVLAAKAAKMQCVAVPHAEQKNHPNMKIADRVLASLEEFNAEMLKQL